MYKPEAEVVYADSLSLQALNEANLDPNVKVVHTHVFSNGEEYTHVTIDGLVVDGDVILGTVDDLEAAIQEYEAYLTSEADAVLEHSHDHEEHSHDLTLQGAMAKPGCAFRLGPICQGRYGRGWPGGRVYFEDPLSNEFTFYERTQIMNAMGHIVGSAGADQIQFVPATSGDRIRFVKSYDNTCSSYLGRIGGVQEVTLAPRCFNGINGYGSVVHEIGHALGMIHEHQRPDRDEYVLILGGDETNYTRKYILQQVTPYDYGSIMHYSTGPGTLLERLQPYAGGEAGQRDALSPLDIQVIRDRYELGGNGNW